MGYSGWVCINPEKSPALAPGKASGVEWVSGWAGGGNNTIVLIKVNTLVVIVKNKSLGVGGTREI
jgi:hypothetical protein